MGLYPNVPGQVNCFEKIANLQSNRFRPISPLQIQIQRAEGDLPKVINRLLPDSGEDWEEADVGWGVWSEDKKLSRLDKGIYVEIRR